MVKKPRQERVRSSGERLVSSFGPGMFSDALAQATLTATLVAALGTPWFAGNARSPRGPVSDERLKKVYSPSREL